jgi:hypothetical protein
MSSWDEFNAWLHEGIDQGWCSEAHCLRHDGLPLLPHEAADLETGLDVCVPLVRLYGMETVQ